MADAHQQAAMLRDLADVMIPGEPGWPSASLCGAHGVLAMRLMALRGEDCLVGLAEAIDRCGGPLAPLDEAGRVAVVERLETSERELFELVRQALYFAYYENPAVVTAIKALGQPYKAVPILEGYGQEPFDQDRDRPRHNRGHYVPTDKVRRLDLAHLPDLKDQPS